MDRRCMVVPSVASVLAAALSPSSPALSRGGTSEWRKYYSRSLTMRIGFSIKIYELETAAAKVERFGCDRRRWGSIYCWSLDLGLGPRMVFAHDVSGAYTKVVTAGRRAMRPAFRHVKIQQAEIGPSGRDAVPGRVQGDI
jgi:hypothetical protein